MPKIKNSSSQANPCAGLCELHEGAITHMVLISNGSMLVTISQDGIMLVSSVDVLVRGIPITQRPHIEMPSVYLMRNADLVALDDRILELKSQVCPVLL